MSSVASCASVDCIAEVFACRLYSARVALHKRPPHGWVAFRHRRSQMTQVESRDRWRYEADEVPKRRHGWNRKHAGFKKVGATLVGKCPSGMSLSDAQGLLDDAVAFYTPRWRHSHPTRLYAVSDGVVYRATPTVPGRSYHGFPEHSSKFPSGRNAVIVKQQLLARAKQLGCEQEVRRWMNW